MNIVQETIDQTISTIVLGEELESATIDIVEKEEQIVSSTPSSSLNPDATPFFAPVENSIEDEQVISTGDESDNEVDSNNTPTSTG